jgi:hypothetical protein
MPPQAPPTVAPPEPDAESGQDTDSPDTITLPPSVTGGKPYKAGDTIQMTVVDVDEDGGCEVKLAGGSEDGGSDDMAGYNMETPDES